MRQPILALVLVGLSACATALPPEPPLRAAPDGWLGASLASPALSIEDRWWLAFNDPVLDALVEEADLGDDLAVAEARLRSARAQLSSARARLRPQLATTAGSQISRVDDLEQTQIQGLVNLAWSPDLNGAIGARTRGADASLRAETARTAAVRQANRATAVRLYIALREAQARSAAADRSVLALEESVALAKSRERAGLTSGLDPVAVRAELAAARTRPLAAREAAGVARLGLEALLGLAPGALADRLVAQETEPLAMISGSDLLSPVSVLARRPDLLAAEADLVAAGFQVEAARRDFWPTISLSAALGGQGVGTQTPSFASGLLGQAAVGLGSPLTSFGRLEAERDRALARRTEAAWTYLRAATHALSEVEQALVASRSSNLRRQTLVAAVDAGRDRHSLADSRYRAGLSSLLDVLSAANFLALAEAELATSRADTSRAHAALSVAMGLGAGA